MEFRIAATFTASLGRLGAPDQKAAKTTAFDLQMDPAAPGLKFHRIERSRDSHFWSIRASSDLRIIVHKTEASFLLAYVGHHDEAYSWAERRRIQAHPRTGAIQIVEERERVEEAAPPSAPIAPTPAPPPMVFQSLSTEDLLAVGVPQDWITDVQAATEDAFFGLADHLPAEAAEALLEYVATGRLRPRAPVAPADPFATRMRCAGFGSSRTRKPWPWPSPSMRHGNNGRSFYTRRSRAWWIEATPAPLGRPARLAPAKRSSPYTVPSASPSKRQTAACC
jgi:hypothetical protein